MKYHCLLVRNMTYIYHSDQLQEKFDIDDEHKDFVMNSMGNKYRSYKCNLKAKYYDPYGTDEERLSNCPPDVSQDDWRWLVHYWGTPKAQVQ